MVLSADAAAAADFLTDAAPTVSAPARWAAVPLPSIAAWHPFMPPAFAAWRRRTTSAETQRLYAAAGRAFED
jgi:hypothetical protein